MNTSQDLASPCIIAFLFFLTFAITVAFIVVVSNFLILSVRSFFKPSTYSPDFYQQVKDLMTDDYFYSLSFS